MTSSGSLTLAMTGFPDPLTRRFVDLLKGTDAPMDVKGLRAVFRVGM
jgi:hypothetical protein